MEKESIFKDKVLMITGGTGSFGNAVLKRFLRTDIGEIRIFSRDEKKQDDMRHEYQVKYPDFDDYGYQTDWSTLYDAVDFAFSEGLRML